MKYYATIKGTAETQKIYVEDKYFYICTSDRMTTSYGDPEEYIKKVKARANKLHKPVIIER